MTLIILPNCTTMIELLSLEQYYIMKLNPTLNHLPIVNPLPGAPTYDLVKYSPEQLVSWRKKHGKALHIYSKDSVLLLSFMSYSEFFEILPNASLRYIVERYLNSSILYKSSIYLTNHMFSSCDKPTITRDVFSKYLENLITMSHSHNDMEMNFKSVVKVTITNLTNEQTQTRYYPSARKCAIILEIVYQVTMSVKTITTYVSKSKKDSCPVVITRGDYKFTIETC